MRRSEKTENVLRHSATEAWAGRKSKTGWKIIKNPERAESDMRQSAAKAGAGHKRKEIIRKKY